MLKTVTFTGADDHTHIPALRELSQKYPFVEWGILVSAKHTGVSPRYPSPAWITDLQRDQELCASMKLSLHVCGRWVRQLLMGKPEEFEATRYLDMFSRVQLNFHGEANEFLPDSFARTVSAWGKDIIMQLDGEMGNEYLESLYEDERDAYGLFDVSGGAGITPDEWPSPIYMRDPDSYAYHGYAGGLGPHNLAEEIPKILAASKGAPIWIDMETHVRTKERFDLRLVQQCCEIAQEFIDN